MNRLPSQRQLRVGELVRHALSELLARGDVREPELEGVVVTVPEVRMSPDLKLATAFLMPLGGLDPQRTVELLDRHRKFLRGALARRLSLKYAPDLRFRVDTSFAEGDRIDALLRSPEVQRDLADEDDPD